MFFGVVIFNKMMDQSDNKANYEQFLKFLFDKSDKIEEKMKICGIYGFCSEHLENKEEFV